MDGDQQGILVTFDARNLEDFVRFAKMSPAISTLFFERGGNTRYDSNRCPQFSGAVVSAAAGLVKVARLLVDHVPTGFSISPW